MKTILLFIGIAFAIQSNAQQVQQAGKIDLKLQTPGQLLQKGSDHLISGILLTTAGGILMGIGANNHEPLLYVGGGMMALGFGFNISGAKKIGLAGRQLK